MNEHIQRKYNQDINRQLMSIFRENLKKSTSFDRDYQEIKVTRYEKFRYYFSVGLYRIKSAWLVLIGKAEIEDY